MPDITRALRVNSMELLRQPGAVKPVTVAVSGAELDVEHPSLSGDVVIDVELEALNDGIAVKGSVVAPWTGVCRRCLRDLAGDAVSTVDELYQVEVINEDAYPILDHQLNLGPMARQLALLELDQERLCQPACAGLCPACGIDLNSNSCECDTTVTDNRWAALDGLVLDDG